ncbi:MAG: hypothetical protein ACOY5F_14415 [Pseudomonadota bacterium]
MSSRTWSEIVEARARTFDLAAKLNASVQSDPVACGWHATALRDMARLLDAGKRERGLRLGSIHLFGLRLTLSRDEVGK